ncbi:PREDICTED: serine protease snake-like [Trachymyrmex septentrionalis]|uniref:serine protease snake-like n=1 Tax=Trachymyrmex septentrionalis TaxID=34720 RepID=UPI00084F60CD|nr:PREDICTED: serine protease snake-like [Trachymyrmex septentrionalis]XP_018343912.1 PREDICTED: serine protease snake-like [Trachymyrmex septentrionalis]
MNFHFGLVVIFVILDVVFVWSTDNGASKKKVQLSFGVATNPFLQSSNLNLPNIQNNPFLYPSNGNRIENPLSNAVVTQASNIAFPNNNYNPFPNSNANPFLRNLGNFHNSTREIIDSKVEVEYSNSPSPVSQTPYTPLPSYHTSTSFNIPVFDTPAPNNDFTFHTPTPKIHPPISHVPSWEELLPSKISPEKTISELKCEEYVREIAGITSVMSLTGSSSGIYKVINTCEKLNRLVVGGTEARVDEFPHMVALGKRNFNEFILMCGGTLISHAWVISAAHCTHGTTGGISDARIGFHSLSDQNGIIIVIKDIKTHPDYKPPRMYADIALVQLMTPVTFSTSVRPACLYQLFNTMPRQVWVSGWGHTEYNGEVSDRLRKAKLDVIDNLSCTIRHNSSLEIPYGIRPSMICAGDPSGNWTRDTCQGDSGGPLQIVDKNECLFQLIGITSFGKACAMIDIPGVYTRVSHYLSWIEGIVWPQGQ